MINSDIIKGLDTPTALVDMQTVRRNIIDMVNGLNKYGINHRPHIKTHKSSYLAKEQLRLGAKGITAAKLDEAEAMAAAGIDDIFIAFPQIGEIKLERLLALAKKVRMSTIVNSVEGARGLASLKGADIAVLVETDGGMGRGGVPVEELDDFLSSIKGLPLNIIGAMSYRGGIYGLTREEDYIAACKDEVQEMLTAAAILKKHGYKADVLSSGSSFSGKFPKYLEGLTEVRAGNYIFNDVNQIAGGTAKEEDCALTVLAAVVGRACGGKRIIIDAGSKTLGADTCGLRKGFGWVCGHPEYTIVKLNEEHGYIDIPEGAHHEIGEKLRIVPNHSCITPNLLGALKGIDGEKVFDIPVDARGVR